MEILPKKSLGQNFLVDDVVLNKIVNLANITNEDVVLEVGPGSGNLTKKIINKHPKKLIVIEKDKKLSELLRNKFRKNIEIINDDVLKFPHSNLNNKPIIIFGNLPYNISTQILANWIKIDNLQNFCKKFILMFQKEVADRIIAKDNSKNYGRLSILSSWKMNIKKIMDINPSSFYPSPKVKSTLLVFEPKINYHKLSNPKNLEYISNVFFTQRRKMIKKPMKILFKNFLEISNSLSLNLNLRPQNISANTYYKICSYYEDSLK
tara:strand:- start:744 stop:1535 length:792 start_codon:yes stop_codon:yes gene_type:complete